MSTRRSIILKWADDQSFAAIDAVSSKQATRKDTLRKVHTVCRALVDRKKPLYPSAAEVAESGSTAKFGFLDFPAKQTLNNQYAEMMGYWRRAFRDIQNLNAERRAEAEELLNWDASHLDAGSFEIVSALKRVLLETIRRNNGLKRLITDNVSVDTDHLRPHQADTLDDLAYWMETVGNDGFSLGEFGLIVTPRTDPGTLIMDRALWDGLNRMIEVYRTSERSKSVLRDDALGSKAA